VTLLRADASSDRCDGDDERIPVDGRCIRSARFRVDDRPLCAEHVIEGLVLGLKRAIETGLKRREAA
jgi:hypothetical protein